MRLAPPKSGGKDTFGVDRQIHFSYSKNVPKVLIITENRGAKEERASGYVAGVRWDRFLTIAWKN